jgi:hypothetical protein
MLDWFEKYYGPLEIITGDATGADAFARGWAQERARKLLEFEADWQLYGRAAGPIRNQRMLDEGRPQIALAFPGGRGTADMMRRCVRADLKVIDG